MEKTSAHPLGRRAGNGTPTIMTWLPAGAYAFTSLYWFTPSPSRPGSSSSEVRAPARRELLRCLCGSRLIASCPVRVLMDGSYRTSGHLGTCKAGGFSLVTHGMKSKLPPLLEQAESPTPSPDHEHFSDLYFQSSHFIPSPP